MQRYGLGVLLGIGLGAVLAAGRAVALPGESIEAVALWIQRHPTLQPASGETLLVRRSDTPARRFTFEALTLSPGRVAQGVGGTIRMEQFSLFDQIEGVSPRRLEESLHVIYGADIYQDFEQARVVYQYPDAASDQQADNRDAPLLSFLQGEVRQGNRFAYWAEVVQTPEGIAYSGQMSVFLIEDMDKLVQELRNR